MFDFYVRFFGLLSFSLYITQNTVCLSYKYRIRKVCMFSFTVSVVLVHSHPQRNVSKNVGNIPTNHFYEIRLMVVALFHADGQMEGKCGRHEAAVNFF
jgi:hypothetical protein